jgi:Icc-related predicted phosphoesterase
MPPKGLSLDVCYNEEKVGSHSVFEWIKREQPLLTLHGHIHESYDVTSVWKRNVGKTLVVQPGQYGFSTNKVRFVKFDLESNRVKSATLVEI